jgi:hypothetical protein
MAKHEGRALVDPNLRNTTAFFSELEKHLQLQYPHFQNIRVERATGTGEGDTMTTREWQKVVFIADN